MTKFWKIFWITKYSNDILAMSQLYKNNKAIEKKNQCIELQLQLKITLCESLKLWNVV